MPHSPTRFRKLTLLVVPQSIPIEEDDAQGNLPAGGLLEGSGGQEGEPPLSFFRSQPQFQQMRNAIRENPALLESIIQQLGANNPEMLRLITQNQDEFMRLLNEDDDGGDAVLAAVAGGGAEEMAEEGGGNAMGIRARVSAADKEAIERLKALGFPEHLVVQAYFACEKNENLAANFLLQDD